ncbi:MAG TPA: hypothetical protein VNW04_09255 [Puia sp.]|jgi:hypothetical protein|nr:hypothetical protein [Puia sp.]
MTRLFLILIATAATCRAAAQKVIDITNSDADVISNERMRGLTGGTIFPPDKYVKVKEGTPYYWDDWANGSLVLDGGFTYQNLQLKIDLLNHEVHYKDADDREMILTAPLREIILRAGGLDARYFIPGKAWADVDKKLANSWLQVLVNDKTSLLLDIRKKLTESNPYNSSTTEQTIEETNVYFLQKGGRLNRLTKWSDLLDLLADKRTEVAKYVKENDLTGVSPLEYADLVAWYNKL